MVSGKYFIQTTGQYQVDVTNASVSKVVFHLVLSSGGTGPFEGVLGAQSYNVVSSAIVNTYTRSVFVRLSAGDIIKAQMADSNQTLQLVLGNIDDLIVFPESYEILVEMIDL